MLQLALGRVAVWVEPLFPSGMTLSISQMIEFNLCVERRDPLKRNKIHLRSWFFYYLYAWKHEPQLLIRTSKERVLLWHHIFWLAYLCWRLCGAFRRGFIVRQLWKSPAFGCGWHSGWTRSINTGLLSGNRFLDKIKRRIHKVPISHFLIAEASMHALLWYVKQLCRYWEENHTSKSWWGKSKVCGCYIYIYIYMDIKIKDNHEVKLWYCV